MGCSRKIRISQ